MIELEHLAEPGARDDPVLDVVARADPSHGGESRLARLPDQGAFRLAGGHPCLGGAARRADVEDLAQELAGLDGGPIELDDQRRPAIRIARMDDLLARLDREAIHHLDRCRRDPRGDDA